MAKKTINNSTIEGQGVAVNATNAVADQPQASTSNQTISSAKSKRENRYDFDRVMGELTRKEERKTKAAERSQNAKEELTAYLNYWGIKPKWQREAEAEEAKKKAEADAKAKAEADAKNLGLLNTEQLVGVIKNPTAYVNSMGQTNVDGGATNNGGTVVNQAAGEVGTAEAIAALQGQRNQNAVEKQRAVADLLDKYNKEVAEGRSAYQKLFETAMQNRENLAQRRERNARSQALSNALGSLVNVLTAGVMGAKGGYAPIVSDYDKTYDSELRKSIEGRYAIQNENENLMLNLQKERLQHEQELKQAGLKLAIDQLNANAKMDDDLLKLLIESEIWKDKSALDLASKIRLAQETAKAKADNPVTHVSVRVGGDNNGKKDSVSSATKNAFVATVSQGLEDDFGNSYGGTKEKYALIQIREKLGTNMTAAQLGKATAHVKELMRTPEGRARIVSDPDGVANEAINKAK